MKSFGPTVALAGALALASAQLQVPLASADLLFPDQAPVGSSSGSAEAPLVDSQKLQDAISITNLMRRASDLYSIARLSEHDYGHPTRVIGSPGHLGTLAYIYANLAAVGDYYDLSNQTFPAFGGTVFASRLVLGNEVAKSAAAMSLSPPTRDREPVRGKLVLVDDDGCAVGDYPPAVRGNIALIRRGTCSFGVKSEHAGRAGAIAAIVYNNEEGSLGGTLGTPQPDHVATLGLSLAEALPVLALLRRSEEVDTIAFVDSEVTTVQTDNIIAQTRGGDPENCVMLGAHSDSVAEGPGINDDGSGSLTLIEVATQLARFEVKNCVRFAWWAGEEEGLLGSDFYADSLSTEENVKIRLFMDYDMLASPNYAYQVYDARDEVNPAGSGALRQLYEDWYTAQKLNHSMIPFDGRSDYDGFIRHAIPAGGIATGAEGVKTEEEQAMFGGHAGEWYDPCYHQLCDGVGNLNQTAWEANARLVAHSVATYAQSLEGFPKRKVEDVEMWEKASAGRLYQGRKLIR